MARFKNTVTGRVVEMPDTPPNLDKIKHPDEDQQKALRKIRAKKYGLTRARYDESTRWERVEDDTPLGFPDGPAEEKPERPDDKAKKDEWQDYVTALGGQPGDLTVDELKTVAGALGG